MDIYEKEIAKYYADCIQIMSPRPMSSDGLTADRIQELHALFEDIASTLRRVAEQQRERDAKIAKEVGQKGYYSYRRGEYEERIRFAKPEDTIARAIREGKDIE